MDLGRVQISRLASQKELMCILAVVVSEYEVTVLLVRNTPNK